MGEVVWSGTAYESPSAARVKLWRAVSGCPKPRASLRKRTDAGFADQVGGETGPSFVAALVGGVGEVRCKLRERW